MTIIKVIIPAYNEEDAIASVIREIPDFVNEIIVVNNNSKDKTIEVATNAGAKVLSESRRGYGFACLKGMDYIASQEIKPDIVVFLDGDYSDYPEELIQLTEPIINQNIDFVIGARVREFRVSGSMTLQQIFGNWLATLLMKFFFNAKFTDLGPFRAIKYSALLDLKMEDKTYGWTVEMQLKVLKQKLTYLEIPVRYKNRIGVSKVSRTLKGTIMAGIKIIGWIIKYSLKK